MRDALVLRQGVMGELLDCVTALEAGEYEAPTAFVSTAGELYLTALLWANTASESLFGATGGIAPPAPATNGAAHPAAVTNGTNGTHGTNGTSGATFTFGAGHGDAGGWLRRARDAVTGFLSRWPAATGGGRPAGPGA
jgi:hypothetical protein